MTKKQSKKTQLTELEYKFYKTQKIYDIIIKIISIIPPCFIGFLLLLGYNETLLKYPDLLNALLPVISEIVSYHKVLVIVCFVSIILNVVLLSMLIKIINKKIRKFFN